MKRIDIVYGGHPYSLGHSDVDELREEVLRRTTENPQGWWMQVNSGEGEARPAYIYITPGVDLAVIPIPGEPAAESQT